MALEETGFKECPPDLAMRLDGLLEAWTTSVPCETAFKHLSDSSFQHRAGQLGRTSRWHRLTCSSLLPELDRELVPITPLAVATKAPAITSAVFDVREAKAKFSLGSDELDKIAGEDCKN